MTYNNKEKKLDFKFIFALYSNIALLNAVEYIKINNKSNKVINESNCHDFFEFNDFWNNAIKKANKEIEKENNNLDVKKDKVDIKKLSKDFISYLRIIRNFYSHKENTENYEDVMKSLFKYDDRVSKNIKLIFKKTSQAFWIDRMGIKDFRMFIIQLFLNKNEFNELKKEIANYGSGKQTSDHFFDYLKQTKRNERFRVRVIKRIDVSIHRSMLNYINNWSETKNKKASFLKMAIKLLNQDYEEYKIKFEYNNEAYGNNQTINPKGQMLVKIKKDNNFIFTNFNGVKKILLTNDTNDIKAIKKEILKYINEPSKIGTLPSFIFNDNSLNPYKIFKNRIASLKLDNRHLLKIFQKTIRLKERKEIYQNNKYDRSKDKYHLNQVEFEILFQSFNIQKTDYIYDCETLVNKLKKYEIIKSMQDDIDKIKANLKQFIINNVTDLEKLKKLNEKESQNENISKITPVKNIRLFYPSNILCEYSISSKWKDLTDKDTYDKANLKTSRDIRKYLVPIVLKYVELNKIIDEKNTINPQQLIKKDQQNNIIDESTFIKIFKNRVPKTTYSHAFIYEGKTYKINNDKLYDIDIVTSKLFWEFHKLLQKTSKQKPGWNDVLTLVNKHKNQELQLFKETMKYDGNDDQDNRYRNYIYHRSISKFKDINDYENFIKKFWIKKISIPVKKT